MAAASKCDRCGNYYDENKETIENGRICGNRYITGFKMVNGRWSGKYFDLCDKCIEKLYEFMGMSEETEEKEGREK